jgi:hypothetical protein
MPVRREKGRGKPGKKGKNEPRLARPSFSGQPRGFSFSRSSLSLSSPFSSSRTLVVTKEVPVPTHREIMGGREE